MDSPVAEPAAEYQHRVLIVDDNLSMRELMAEMLEDEGYVLIQADNGEQALQIVESDPPDLILLDVRMPGMSGFEVCKRVREIADESSISIAMVTGLEDHESIETAYKLGATSFLNKPINWNNFPHRIRYILKSRDALAQLKQREIQLSHVDRVTRILTQDRHYDEIMQETLLAILDIFDAERAFVIKSDVDSSIGLHIEYSADRDGELDLRGNIDPILSDIVRSLQQGSQDLDDPVISHGHASDSVEGLNQQMLLPLHLQKTATWYICVQQYHEGEEWRQDDSDIFYNIGTRLNDILSQHLLLEKLHRSERLLNQAQQIGRIGNWQWNSGTGTMAWSDEIYRILGFRVDELVPTYENYYRVAYEEDLVRLGQLRGEAQKTGKPYEIEYRIRLPDDSIRWVNEQAISSTNIDGEVTEINGVLQDITDRHRKQEQEAHEKKMESIGQLTSGIAHDFGNLMTIARGNLDILSEMIADRESDQEEDEILEDARSAISDGVELTRQLMNFSRKKSISPEYVNVSAQLQNLVKLLNHTLTDNIALSMQQVDDLPDILVDPVQLESALLNIAINARNAMPDGGTITVEAQHLKTDPSVYIDNPMIDIGDECVVITIADTGIGMSEEIVNRAIEPFFTTRSGDGTGLGLSMVYGFMRQSRGELHIDSVLDVGTSVQLLFPIYHGIADDVDAETQIAIPTLNDATLLVVEDQDSVRQFAIRCLSPLDTRILQACDADEAIAILQHHDVDLMFSDIMMPGSMDGRRLAEWAREERPDMRILLTTASASQIQRNEQDEESAFELLPKPYSKQDLLTAVHIIMTRN